MPRLLNVALKGVEEGLGSGYSLSGESREDQDCRYTNMLSKMNYPAANERLVD